MVTVREGNEVKQYTEEEWYGVAPEGGKAWKTAKVGDRAWITFYDHRYLQNAQHLCEITCVGEQGIIIIDRGGDDANSYALLGRDIVSYEKIDE